MDQLICIRYPHLFKPTQAVVSVMLLISIGSSTPVDGSGVLWFVALFGLTISTVATVLFMLDQNEPVMQSLSGGLIGWTVVEFVYSTVMTALCGVSVWLSFGYASHVPEGGHSTGYVFTGLFMLLQTVCFATPATMIYERIQWENTNQDTTNAYNDHTQPQNYQEVV